MSGDIKYLTRFLFYIILILVMESGGFLFMNNKGVSKAERSLTASLYNCLKAPFLFGERK